MLQFFFLHRNEGFAQNRGEGSSTRDNLAVNFNHWYQTQALFISSLLYPLYIYIYLEDEIPPLFRDLVCPIVMWAREAPGHAKVPRTAAIAYSTCTYRGPIADLVLPALIPLIASKAKKVDDSLIEIAHRVCRVDSFLI
jgi:hypothetical protein